MIEFKELKQHPGYRFGSDGTVWTSGKKGWRRLKVGRGVVQAVRKGRTHKKV